LAKLTGSKSQVYAAAFAPDGKSVVSVAEDKRARIHDAATGKQLASWEGGDAPLYSVSISPDGKRIATTGAGGTIRLWDFAEQLAAKQ
jgi:WD40 repeat protein